MSQKTPKKEPHKDLTPARGSKQRMRQVAMPWAERDETETWPSYTKEFIALVPRHSLAQWMAKYLKEEVAGVQAQNTLEAKTRDLGAFAAWMVDAHGAADVRDWLPRDTQRYLHTLERQGKAPTTVNRAFASLRHFVRWANDQPGGVFRKHGSPLRGIKELVVEEPDCKKLDLSDMHRLFRAADRLVDLADASKRKNARPRRNRAILSVLFYTGLRVSELVALKMEQWEDKHLMNVARKGRTRSKCIYLVAECRNALNDYVGLERGIDTAKGPAEFLFLSSQGGHLWRKTVQDALEGIAREASKNLAKSIQLHPHRLRHTFGAIYREKSGSDTETAAALGHTGLSHVRRYVRKSQAEREKYLTNFLRPE